MTKESINKDDTEGSWTANLLNFFFIFKSTIYYMGHVGRLWQVQSTYLNKKRNKETEIQMHEGEM